MRAMPSSERNTAITPKMVMMMYLMVVFHLEYFYSQAIQLAKLMFDMHISKKQHAIHYSARSEFIHDQKRNN